MCLSVGLLQTPAVKANPLSDPAVVAVLVGFSFNLADTLSGMKAKGPEEFYRLGLNCGTGAVTQLAFESIFPGVGTAWKATVEGFNYGGGTLPLFKALSALCSKLPKFSDDIRFDDLNFR